MWWGRGRGLTGEGEARALGSSDSVHQYLSVVQVAERSLTTLYAASWLRMGGQRGITGGWKKRAVPTRSLHVTGAQTSPVKRPGKAQGVPLCDVERARRGTPGTCVV